MPEETKQRVEHGTYTDREGGTAGQTAGNANANAMAEAPIQDTDPQGVVVPPPPSEVDAAIAHVHTTPPNPPHEGHSVPDDTDPIDARGIALSHRSPPEKPLDPRGVPGVAEAAEAEAEAAAKRRAEELRAEADAIERGDVEGEVDLNEDAGAPLDDAGNPVVEGRDPHNPPPIEDDGEEIDHGDDYPAPKPKARTTKKAP